MNRTVTLLDLINLSALIRINEALDLDLINVMEKIIWESGIRHEIFQCLGIYIYQEWQEYTFSDFKDDSPGRWYDPDTGQLGSNVTSLLQYLGSPRFQEKCLKSGDDNLRKEAARKCLTCDDPAQIVSDLATRLGIDLQNPFLKYWPMPRGFSQVAGATKSSPSFPPEWNASTGPWPWHRVNRVPVIDIPNRTFHIEDRLGRPHLIIGEWQTEWGKPLLMPFAIVQVDADPLRQCWLPIRPTLSIPLHQLNIALACPTTRVLLLDDLGQVDSLNTFFRSPQTETRITAVGWPGGLPDITPDDMDWAGLEGRDVVCSVDLCNQKSVERAISINKKLVELGIGSLAFAPLATAFNGPEERLGENIFQLLANELCEPERLMEIGRQHFNFTPHSKSTRTTLTWKIGDRRQPDDMAYLVTNLIPKACVILIYSLPGVGKSFDMLLASYVLGAGRSLLGERWKAPQVGRTLYIAAEKPKMCATRLERIHGSLGWANAVDNISIFPHPDQPSRKIDLESDATWIELEGHIAEADHIVIDHLTAVSSGRDDVSSWKRIWRHLEQLRDRGKTVVVLHHSSKNGDQRGTGQRLADVDWAIRMSRLEDTENGVQFDFEKHRDDQSLGKELSPYRLYWGKEQGTGLIRWWAEDDKTTEKAWRPIPDDVVNEGRNLNLPIIDERFPDRRQAKIIRTLLDDHLRDGHGLGISQLEATLKISSSTILTALKPLLEADFVQIRGKGKATRYLLSPALAGEITEGS